MSTCHKVTKERHFSYNAFLKKIHLILLRSLFVLPILYGCGGTGDGTSASNTSSDTSSEPRVGIDPEDPSHFQRLPNNLRFSPSAWAFDTSTGPITSGISHGLSSWIGKDLLCNGRNAVSQINVGIPEFVRYEQSGIVSRRSAVGAVNPSCDESTISDPDVCFLEDSNLGEWTWGVFTLQGADGSNVQAIYDGFEVNTDLATAIDGISYQDGFINYEGMLVSLDGDGGQVCILIENATVAQSDIARE